MTTDDQIRDEKLQYHINREATKISAWSSGKMDKYDYLTSEERLLTDQRRITEQDKFTYSPLGFFRKSFWKQIKKIKNQGGKQTKSNWLTV